MGNLLAARTTWYHGTSTEHLRSIRQNGLDRPHLTTSPRDAADYAEATAWGTGHDPVVLRVDKPSPRHHRYDQMAMASPPEHREVPDTPEPHEQTWQRSARDVGAIYHDAVIPPEKISVHRHIEAKLASDWASKERCPCCGTGDHPCGHECTACDGSGTKRAFDADGVGRCHLPHGGDCRCPHGQAPSGRPWKRIFGPTYGLDKRLFDGDQLKPEVRSYVLDVIGAFWDAQYPAWQEWAIVYFSGSEASEWTSEELIGNNDFDVLIGVNYEIMRDREVAVAHLDNLEITSLLNQGLKSVLDKFTDPVWIPVRSTSWHPRQDSISHNAMSWSSSTETEPLPPRSQSSTTSESRRSAATSTTPGSSVISREGKGEDGRAASRATSARSRPTPPSTVPVTPARRATSGTIISGSASASTARSSTASSPSREEGASSVVERTSSSSWTTTTGAAQDRSRAGSVSGASSAPDTTRPSPISVSPIFAPRSTTWTADSPPPAPEGWEYIGPFDGTFFVNPDSYHIADIKPYAAYDCTHDQWAVRPPHLPGWRLEDFPEGPGLEEFCWGFEDMVRATLDMPEPYRHQEGFALWHFVHDERSDAFGPQGEGWWDLRNVLEKWLDQKGLMAQLYTLMDEAREDPHLLDAPEDWSNTPVLAHLTRFSDLRSIEVAALRCVSPKQLARVGIT